MSKTFKTDAEIDAEIKALEAAKLTVRKRNGFGDDNHAAIDAQIRVLRERMTNDDIYDAFEDADDPENRHELDAAIEAHEWMTGASDEPSPAQGWA